jgi:putative heme iron utilization protein
MNRTAQAALEARALLHQCYDGVLSTQSVAMPGYPFGSVVPFCLDRHSSPVVLIADIAQHTKNVLADPRVSLIVFDRSADDLQAGGRLTLLADATPIAAGDTDDIAARYYRYFPEARDYHLTHGFAFFRLAVRRLRFIGGFGAIHWLEPEAVLDTNPFDAATEASMAAHMDADHVPAMQHYLRTLLGIDPGESVPRFAGCDADGFHLGLGSQILRVPFKAPVKTPGDVRSALAGLARS